MAINNDKIVENERNWLLQCGKFLFGVIFGDSSGLELSKHTASVSHRSAPASTNNAVGRKFDTALNKSSEGTDL